MVSGKVLAGGFLLERSGDRSAISFGWHMVAPNDSYQDMAPVFFNQILSPKAKVPGSSMFQPLGAPRGLEYRSRPIVTGLLPLVASTGLPDL